MRWNNFKRVEIKLFNKLKQRRTRLLNHEPPCWTLSCLHLTEKVAGIFPRMEQVVPWLTQKLNHVLHLQRKHSVTVDIMNKGSIWLYTFV